MSICCCYLSGVLKKSKKMNVIIDIYRCSIECAGVRTACSLTKKSATQGHQHSGEHNWLFPPHPGTNLYLAMSKKKQYTLLRIHQTQITASSSSFCHQARDAERWETRRNRLSSHHSTNLRIKLLHYIIQCISTIKCISFIYTILPKVLAPQPLHTYELQ